MMNCNYLLGHILREHVSLYGRKKPILYLVEGECADTVSGQLHSVQHGDLDHSIGLCSSRRPVLVTLHLAEARERAVCQE